MDTAVQEFRTSLSPAAKGAVRPWQEPPDQGGRPHYRRRDPQGLSHSGKPANGGRDRRSVIDHIFFWDDALRPWIHARDPEDSKHPRKFTFRIIPRDMREIYFRDPASNTYIAIPYRDRTRPPVSRWEILAAEKRLREAGYARVDEVLIFHIGRASC